MTGLPVLPLNPSPRELGYMELEDVQIQKSPVCRLLLPVEILRKWVVR